MRALFRHWLFRNWPLAALIVSGAALGVAHAFETFGHLAPCTLCLKQREVYWIAMALAAGGVAAGWSPWRARGVRVACVALAIAFLWSAWLAGYHAGVEWHWWPGPQECSGGSSHVNSADLTALLRGAKMAPPACDRAAWVFLGLSMAGWNFLLSLGLAALSIAAAAHRRVVSWKS